MVFNFGSYSTEKKSILYELLHNFWGDFSCLHGQNFFEFLFDIVVTALKSCLIWKWDFFPFKIFYTKFFYRLPFKFWILSVRVYRDTLMQVLLYLSVVWSLLCFCTVGHSASLSPRKQNLPVFSLQVGRKRMFFDGHVWPQSKVTFRTRRVCYTVATQDLL